MNLMILQTHRGGSNWPVSLEPARQFSSRDCYTPEHRQKTVAAHVNSRKEADMAIADLSTHLDVWLEGFLVDRKAQNLARGTILFYQIKLTMCLTFCGELAITQIEQITPDILRH